MMRLELQNRPQEQGGTVSDCRLGRESRLFSQILPL